MAAAKNGDIVKVHYTGRLANGTEFDSSKGREPLEVVLGDHQVIPGFEEALFGSAEGQKKTVTIPPEEAYGSYNPEFVGRIERTMLPADIEPQVGMMLQVADDQGGGTPVVITEVTPEAITVDGNHPLAGQQLIFDLEIVKIV